MQLTRLHGRPLTPEYASPEQLSGQATTTSCDVYALGIVFYELLTRTHPFEPSATSRTGDLTSAKETRQRRPLAPSRVKRLIGSPFERISEDLDAIALKSLHADNEMRYRAASAFAEDLECYLAKLPVSAQPDSQWYRLRKFISRNVTVVAATAAIAVSLLAGIGVAGWQAHDAKLQRNTAQRESEKAIAVKDFLIRLFEVNRDDQIAAVQKRNQPIATVLTDAARTLPTSLEKQPETRAALLRVLGDVMFGLSLMESALNLRQAQLASLIESRASLSEVERARLEIAMVEVDRGDWDSGRKRLEEVVSNLTGASDHDARVRRADALSILGQMRAYSFDAKGAIELLDASIGEVETIDKGNGSLMIEPLTGRAAAYSDLGDAASANRDMQRAIRYTETLYGQNSLKLAIAHYRDYEVQITLDNVPRATQAARAALEVTRRMQTEDSFWGARANMALGRSLLAQGQLRPALDALERSITTFDRIAKELEPQNSIVARAYAAEAAAQLGDWRNSTKYLDEAEQLFNATKEHGGQAAEVSLARAKIPYLLQAAKAREAEVLSRSVLAALEKAGGTSPEIGAFTAVLAQALIEQEKFDVAKAEIEKIDKRTPPIVLPRFIEERLRIVQINLRTRASDRGGVSQWTTLDSDFLQAHLSEQKRAERPLLNVEALVSLSRLAAASGQPAEAHSAARAAIARLDSLELQQSPMYRIAQSTLSQSTKR
ncbi:MAG: protein kinase domain-containing protein [Casimicrobium sp.]